MRVFGSQRYRPNSIHEKLLFKHMRTRQKSYERKNQYEKIRIYRY